MEWQRSTRLTTNMPGSQGQPGAFIKFLPGTLGLFCALGLFFALASTTYALNPNQKTTSTGQILTIQIVDPIAEVTHEISSSAVITLTGHATLAASQWQTGTLTTRIDHVEVEVAQGAPITATLDGQGDWSVTLKRCTLPAPLTATAVAQNGTRVTANFTLCGPVAMPTAPEPPQNGRLDKFFFLPIIGVRK